MIGDESCISLSHVARSLDDGAIRTVSVKTARTGFTESRRILDHCLARAIPVVVGSQYEGAVGVLATVGVRARRSRPRPGAPPRSRTSPISATTCSPSRS